MDGCRPSPPITAAAAAASSSSKEDKHKLKHTLIMTNKNKNKNKRQSRDRHHPSLLFCATLFVVVYIQITTNFFYVYHYHYNYNYYNHNQNHHAGPITKAVSDYGDDQQQHLTQQQQHLLDGLRSRLRRLEGETDRGGGGGGDRGEGEDNVLPLLPPYYEDDGNFVAFMIRDARRTVSTNVIPDGFHVFDILDLNGGNVDEEKEEDHEDEEGDELEHGFQSRHHIGNRRHAKQQQQQKSRADENSTGAEPSTTTTQKKKKIKVTDQISTTKATTFHNGYALPASFQARCQTYSLKCYRMKIASVFEYLLKMKRPPSSSSSNINNNNKNINQHEKTNLRRPRRIQDSVTPNTTYFFYMEPDNNLCVPLTEIRRLAYKYQRYFISTGVGFSGYIMNRTFVEDFVVKYEGQQSSENRKKRNMRHINVPWLKHDKEEPTNATISPTATTKNNNNDEEVVELHPEIVAGQILKEKQAWSVTRRYLTSHTVLRNSPGFGGEGMASLTDLFGTDSEQQHALNNNSSTLDDPEDEPGRHNEEQEQDEDEDKEAANDTAAANNSTNSTQIEEEEPDNGIARHLPRCLEPHRGIWWKVDEDDENENTVNSSSTLLQDYRKEITDKEAVQNDIDQWNFFSYDLCPDSEVFPCKEGQLSQLYDEGNEKKGR